MPIYEIKTKLNIVEFTQKCYENGYGAIIPVINGKEYPELTIGYTSENDMKSGINLLREAINSTNNISQAKGYLLRSMYNMAKGIHNPNSSECVEVNGNNFIISYSEKKAYFMNGIEVARANDVNTTDKDILKIVLTDRILLNTKK